MTTEDSTNNDGASPLGVDEQTLKLAPRRGKRPAAALGRLDRYLLLRRLGSGGFGAVYRARDEEAGIDVAIKVLPSIISSNPDELEAIRQNFRLVAKLRHPYIANVLHLHTVEYVDPLAESATGVAIGDRLLVMDFVPGETLLAWRRHFPKGIVPLSQAIAVAEQIAEALDYAHSRKIVHRDIKPANVIITPSGEVRILDFGLAAQIKASLTQASQFGEEVSGTPAYMPPEQWAGRPQNAAADQYGLAVLIYEMLAGEVPFASAFASNDHQVMYAAVKNEPTAPIRALDRASNRALLRALAKDPRQRFASCRDFVTALGGRVRRKAALPDRLQIATHGDSFAPPPPPRRAAALAQSLLTVLLVVMATLLAVQHFNPARQSVEALSEGSSASLLVQELLDQAREAANRGENQTAEALVARVLALAPDHLAAQSLQAALTTMPGMADVVPLKSEANAKWEQAKQFDRGQGFGELIDRGETVLAAAELLFSAGEYRQAIDRYRQILANYDTLVAMENNRGGARLEQNNAADARQRALLAGGDAETTSFFRGADRLVESAHEAFERGDFVKASRLWITASAEFAKAQAQAMGTLAAELARQAYEERLKTTDAALLEAHAGAAWREITLAAENAVKLAREGQWDRAVANWVQARARIDPALAAAAESKVRLATVGRDRDLDASLAAAMAARSLANAETAKASGDWGQVRHFAAEALAFDPESTAAKTLMTRAREALSLTVTVVALDDELEVRGAHILVDGVDSEIKTPGELRLERGREYGLRVVHKLTEGGVRYKPFETTLRADEQEGMTVRATLLTAPLPTDLLVIPEAEASAPPDAGEAFEEARRRQRGFALANNLPLDVASAQSEIAFKLVPPGQFTRDVEGAADGSPSLATIGRGFYLAKTEITRGQWRRVMGAEAPGTVPEDLAEIRDRLPVTEVSFVDAIEFCRRLNELEEVWANTYRLPSEWQWEYACRGGVRVRFRGGGGDDDPARNQVGWHGGNSDGRPHPVGQKDANAWGLYDLLGNAAEWCRDWKGPLPPANLTDYTGPETGGSRVVKGGSFLLPPPTSSPDWRDGLSPEATRPDLGFRILRLLPE